MKYQAILFDIDGTLCDPGNGIVESVQHALLKMGINEQDPAALQRFVGPPLGHSFQQYYDFTDDQSQQAIEHYRKNYRQHGLSLYTAYAGIEQLLKTLKVKSLKLGVVTAKITEFGEQALTNTELIDYFDFVCGTYPDRVETKSVTIAEALAKIPDIPVSSVVMIGDREHDIVAANDNDIDSIGVLYGYGDAQEFLEAGATYTVAGVDELTELLTN